MTKTGHEFEGEFGRRKRREASYNENTKIRKKSFFKKSTVKRQSKHQNHTQLWRGFENGYTENLNQQALVS